MGEWVIREAGTGDRSAILAIVEAAFGGGGGDASEELAIVTKTWERGCSPAGHELVAEVEDGREDGRIVGHVLAALGSLDGRPVPGVAPLSVAPAHQRRGVGTALMTELLQRGATAGWPAMVVLGDPDYYGRFGFEPAGPVGIAYPPVGAGNPHFMVCRLAHLPDGFEGTYAYCFELPDPAP